MERVERLHIKNSDIVIWQQYSFSYLRSIFGCVLV